MAETIACVERCPGLRCACIQHNWRLMADLNRELQTRVRRAEAEVDQRTFEVNALRAELIRLREAMRDAGTQES